jgi:hypothetical protein
VVASLDDRVVVGPGVLVRPIGDESVLLNVTTETYFGLDPIGTRMWTVLLGATSIRAACDALLAEYEIDADALRRDVEAFVDELVTRQLVYVQSRA